MASVERAMAKASAALLPGLLPTPPPMCTPSPCIIVLQPATSNPKQPKPGRADAVQRWDAHKNNRPRSPASSCGSTSPGRADSCERWDIPKKKQSPNSSSSALSSSMSISGERYKRPPSRRASSADRWDAHKKPRDAPSSDAESQTSDQPISNKEHPKEMEETAPRTHVMFSGPTFVASPKPSMLPIPAFFPRRAGMIPLPAFLQVA